MPLKKKYLYKIFSIYYNVYITKYIYYIIKYFRLHIYMNSHYYRIIKNYIIVNFHII